jgi:hypothetical protein
MAEIEGRSADTGDAKQGDVERQHGTFHDLDADTWIVRCWCGWSQMSLSKKGAERSFVTHEFQGDHRGQASMTADTGVGWDVWESPELPRCGADLTHAVYWVHTSDDDAYGPHHDRHIVWCSDCKRALIVLPQDNDPERVYPRSDKGRKSGTPVDMDELRGRIADKLARVHKGSSRGNV